MLYTPTQSKIKVIYNGLKKLESKQLQLIQLTNLSRLKNMHPVWTFYGEYQLRKKPATTCLPLFQESLEMILIANKKFMSE